MESVIFNCMLYSLFIIDFLVNFVLFLIDFFINFKDFVVLPRVDFMLV